jgi:hypothetical protein
MRPIVDMPRNKIEEGKVKLNRLPSISKFNEQ